MTKSKGIRKKHNIGDIIIRPDGTQWKVGVDRKWVYIKKPKGYFKKDQPKKKWVNNFPPVTLPDHIKPTKYPHYYVSNDGIAYREPRRCDENGRFGKVNEFGLIELTTQLRGNPNHGKEFMYESVNIYFYDENGKNVGHKKRNIHQLVAEVWIPNPHEYDEVLHGDKGNRCNHYTNLRWGTHKENMEEASHTLPDGTQRRSHGKNGSLYEKKDGEWVLVPKVDKKTGKKIPWNKGLKGVAWNTLPDGSVTTRKVNGFPAQFIKQNGEWIYQKKKCILPDGTIRTDKDGSKRKKINGKWVYLKKDGSFSTGMTERPLPDGTIRTRSDGTIWIKENGAWVYQKKKKA